MFEKHFFFSSDELKKVIFLSIYLLSQKWETLSPPLTFKKGNLIERKGLVL